MKPPPDLARERTVLARQRTGLSCLAAAAIGARVLTEATRIWWAFIPFAVLTGLGIAVFVRGRRQHVPPWAIRLLSAVVAGYGVAGLFLVAYFA